MAAVAGQTSILVFGGTFDPPHLAHVELPRRVARSIGCGRIIYIPARLNPLKADSPPTANHHRLAMLRLALDDEPNVEISTLELDRPGPSYMVDTLDLLREVIGEEPKLRLLIGADQAVEFHRWKNWRRVVEQAEPVIMLRPPWDEASLRRRLRTVHDEEETNRWMSRLVRVPEVPTSSSELREQLRKRADTDAMLDPRVIDYIEAHGLYAD
ncbi:MAG TPA: nicotinate (nicotinamide) nucleotide adenylyltransferase [Phycisphaerales bacterium]|nr:nicotinate (nicotinamide) nucleotide adenylyltransferase [Phycisphaerales bacterium]HRQ74611.1 nicotinate (nicotinamide) nucleotide adenylyltransferase [Phycisphaerales bacterium]